MKFDKLHYTKRAGKCWVKQINWVISIGNGIENGEWDDFDVEMWWALVPFCRFWWINFTKTKYIHCMRDFRLPAFSAGNSARSTHSQQLNRLEIGKSRSFTRSIVIVWLCESCQRQFYAVFGLCVLIVNCGLLLLTSQTIPQKPYGLFAISLRQNKQRIESPEKSYNDSHQHQSTENTVDTMQTRSFSLHFLKPMPNTQWG